MKIRWARYGRRELIGATALLVPLAAAAAWIARPPWAGWILAAPFVGVWAWVMYFFRDPDRPVPDGEGLFVSPADGVVTDVTVLGADSELGRPGVRIGVFMNLFDVHVNRAPCDGTVVSVRHTAGTRLDVRSGDAWRRNESVLIALRLAPRYGSRVVLVRQVAGLVARRIVCDIAEGADLDRGERIGMIKFGSRLELLLPDELNAEVRVCVGRRVRAGSTVMAAASGGGEGVCTDG